MDTKIIAGLKAQLEKTKTELEAELKKLNEPVDMGDDIDSFDEETDEATEYSANQGMAQTLKARYHRVQDALAKIKAGQYGMCEQCGKPIEPEVLRVDPESGMCRECKLKTQK
jgi:DnaK suppressor protein